MSDEPAMRPRRSIQVWATLGLLVGSAGVARANDIDDAVRYVDEFGLEDARPAFEDRGDDAHDHSALAFINSRNYDPEQTIESYECDDSPVDQFVFRTSGNQKWAHRICQEERFRKKTLRGFTTMGPPPLNARKVERWVERAAGASEIPAVLIDTITRFVSGYRPGLVSEVGHTGIMQLRPEVLDAMGIPYDNLLDPAENLRVGAIYLRHLIFRFGDLKKALAAFLDGPHVVEAAGNEIPKGRKYVAFIRNVTKLYYASQKDFPSEIGSEAVGFVWTWLD